MLNLVVLGGLNLDYVLGAGIHIDVMVSDNKHFNIREGSAYQDG